MFFASCSTPEDQAEKQLMKQVDRVYSRLSINEKAAQLFGFYPNELITDGKLDLELCRQKIPYGVGHICQCTSSLDMDADQIRQFVKDIQDYLINETPAGIPAIIHDEALAGVTAKGATSYPQSIGIACTWNPGLLKQKTTLTAEKMRAVGQQLALSPMVDLVRNANWSRIEESCGEDSYLTAAMGTAFVQGLQSKGLKEGVAATTKHFLGYGGANTLPWKEIYEEVLYPHEAIIRTAGSTSLMTSYDKFRSQYAVASDTLIQHILRGYLHYDGLVVTDYYAMNQNDNSGNPESLKRYAIEAIKAGNDLEFPNDECYRLIPQLIEEGALTEKDIEPSVKRALLMKARAGLLDKDPVLYVEGPLDMDPAESRQVAYELAAQSMVLLKNNGELPLAEGKSVAVVGPNANSSWSMLGDYTFQCMQKFFFNHEVDQTALTVETFLEAFSAKYPGRVAYERGCDWSSINDMQIMKSGDQRARLLPVRKLESSDPTDWKSAIKLASESDVIIAAMGENIFLCGENRSRSSIRLPGDQEQFVKDLIATGKPVVLVMFGGRPMVIDAIADGCAAIIEAWYPGEEGANALTDILNGTVNPSGKLCVSYPRTEAGELYCYNNQVEPEKVAWPFGFGLSYSAFKYSDIKIEEDITKLDSASSKNQSPASTADDLTKLNSVNNNDDDSGDNTASQLTVSTNTEWISVSCDVTNTSNTAGTEIVQLYASPASGQPLKPLQLKGFTRVALAPGETTRVTFRLALDQLAWFTVNNTPDGSSRGSYYDIENNPAGYWTISDGSYTLSIGTSSATLPVSATLTLTGNPVKKQLRNHYFADTFSPLASK